MTRLIFNQMKFDYYRHPKCSLSTAAAIDDSVMNELCDLVLDTEGRLSLKRNATAAAAPAATTEFVLEEFLPYQLAVTANRVSRLFAKHYSEEAGVSIPEFRVLTVVGRNSGISPSEVGEKSMMDKVKVSRAAATLVSRGLLKQSPHPTDGRARMLRLTKRGEALLASLVPLAETIEHKLVEGMGRNSWSALRQALTKLNSHIPADDGAAVEE
jgi:DNA-binding MarR family transcriptional regulator